MEGFIEDLCGEKKKKEEMRPLRDDPNVSGNKKKGKNSRRFDYDEMEGVGIYRSSMMQDDNEAFIFNVGYDNEAFGDYYDEF